jgi:hypothetical protein
MVGNVWAYPCVQIFNCALQFRYFFLEIVILRSYRFYIYTSGRSHIALYVIYSVRWAFRFLIKTYQHCTTIVSWDPTRSFCVCLPLVSASITPDFSRYLRNSSFFESGVYEGVCVSEGRRDGVVCLPDNSCFAGTRLQRLFSTVFFQEKKPDPAAPGIAHLAETPFGFSASTSLPTTPQTPPRIWGYHAIWSAPRHSIWPKNARVMAKWISRLRTFRPPISGQRIF